MKQPAKLQRAVALAAVAALAASLGACGQSKDDGDKGGGGPSGAAHADTGISVAIQEPDHLTPGNHYSSYEILIAVFSPLTILNDQEELEFLQAESVDSEDAITWTIKLRDGWTFHNGEPVTAQSYVDAWNHTAYGPNAWVNSGQLRNVVGYDQTHPVEGEPTATELAGLKVVDDLTFTVELVGADRQFPFQLSDGQTGLYPMPQAAYEDLDAFDKLPIGNGPFKMAKAWESGQDVVVEAYADYAGPAPTISQINFRTYIDTDTAYTDALAGEVDIAAVAGAKVAIAAQDFGERLHSLDAPGVDFLGFNPADERFSDVRVRQAFSMAIDRAAINEAIYSGAQIPSTSLTASTMPGSPEGVCGKYCEFDPAAAKSLLEEAGGVEGAVEILFPGGWGLEDVFEAYANQLRQNLEIDVTALPATDWAEFTDKIATGDYHINRGRWGALYPSQQDTLHSLYTAAGDGNFATGGYSNPQVDALLAAADAAPTLEDSFEGYRAVQEAILADFPVIPTFGNRYLYVTSDRIADLHSAAGSVRFAYVELAG
ncbi:MAG: ABC transporter substrate-binding protein [Bifidobacteriaceae bacterium]|jgi:ABC-type transport system substrate-binding protein|nr:ABC transporter substrate-binding protein [Bifidobacteriaceae bacterium]